MLDQDLDVLAGSEDSYRKLASFKGAADLVIGQLGEGGQGEREACNLGLNFRLGSRGRGEAGGVNTHQ